MTVRRLLTFAGLSLVSLQLQSQEIAISQFSVADVDTGGYGACTHPITITYTVPSGSNRSVDPESINPWDIRIVLTDAGNPQYADWELEPQSVEVTTSPNGVTAVYEVWTAFEGWNPNLSGTWTVIARNQEVYTDLDPLSSERLYLPEGPLGTFVVSIDTIPQIAIRGRIWQEAAGTGSSLEDEGPEVDPGIHEWSMIFERLMCSGDWLGYGRYLETADSGSFVQSGLAPGLYRVSPDALHPLVAPQGAGDPTRGGIRDGYMYVDTRNAQDGEEFVVNFSYLPETDLPDTAYDDLGVPFGVQGAPLDVLANDSGTGLVITGLTSFLDLELRYFTTDKLTTGLGNTLWTNGQMVFFTPARSGWDLFWYEVTDSDGNTDIERAWVYTSFPGTSLISAVGDSLTVDLDEANIPIDVLQNDMVLEPLFRDDVSLSVNSDQSEAGGTVSVSNRILRYSAPEGFSGIDRIHYTVSAGLYSSSATVVIHVMDSTANVAVGDEAIMHSVEWHLLKSPQGRLLSEFFNRFFADFANISLLLQQLEANGSLTLAPFEEEPASPDLLNRVIDDLFPAVVRLLSGEGDQVTFTEEMAATVNEAIEAIEAFGSPAFVAALEVQKAAIGPVDDLVGKSIDTLSMEIAGLDPARLSIPLFSTVLNASGFSVKTFNNSGQALTLWKLSDLNNPLWEPVPQEVTDLEDVVLTLSDPSPTFPGWYRIEAIVDAPANGLLPDPQ